MRPYFACLAVFVPSDKLFVIDMFFCFFADLTKRLRYLTRPFLFLLLALIFIFVSFLSLFAGGCGTSGSPVDNSGDKVSTLPQAAVEFLAASGPVGLKVEEASTPDERRTGLMGRQQLAPDAGMLFLWNRDSSESFWMKNTLIPLDVAFISADGTILDIQSMEPRSLTLHSSPRPYRMAVEANTGFFNQHGIRAGDRMQNEPVGSISPP